MANIMDYLDWRGDLSLCTDPFNEVDNYICSQLGTPDFSLIIPENEREITLKDAVSFYTSLWGERGDKLGVLASPMVLPLLRKCVDTVRFGQVKLSHFVNIVDEDSVEQFSAVCVHLCDGSCYIAFRGTDDSIMGWKEDFLLSVLDQVPAQKDALEYLQKVASEVEGELILGGHSKGGNLAVYAAINAPEEIQARIADVYNNDGPGFRESVMHTPGYERMETRLHTILPQHSVVGVLLEQTGHPSIVKSSRAGAESHDGFNWAVLGTRFVREKEFSRSSNALHEAVERAIAGKNQQERREFVDAFFDLLGSTGARTLTELLDRGKRSTLALLRESRKNPLISEFVSEVAENALKEYAEDMAEDVLDSVKDYAEDVVEFGKRLLGRDETGKE